MTYYLAFTVTSYKEANSWVLFNWLNTANVIIDDPKHPIYQMLEKGSRSFSENYGIEFSEDISYLENNYFIVESQEIVRCRIHEAFKEQYDKDRTMSLTLLPVSQECNFNCIYCAQKHQPTAFMGHKEMDIVSRFLQKSEPKRFRVDYFGGEPLLNEDFIESMNERLIEISSKNGSVFLGSSVTTNGYLLSLDVFKRLYLKKVINYQITIDGSRQLHNTMRPLSTGEGTYDVIMKNLLDIKNLDQSYDFSVTLRVNFNHELFESENLSQFISSLEPFVGDKRFKIMPQAIENWKREIKDNFYCNYSEKAKMQHDFEDELEKAGFYTVGTILFSDPGSHCCYCSRPNNFVLYPYENGKGMKIQKCTREVYVSQNNVGYLVDSGDMILNDNYGTWISNSPFEEEKCKNCFFVMHCFGNSCPYNNWEKGTKVCPPIKDYEVYYAKRIIRFIQSH